MYLLKRVATRAAVQQPSRQLSTLRPSCRVTTIQPSFARTFHQTRIWRADEPAKSEEAAKDELAKGETKEESIATPEVADAATPQADAAHDAVSESSGTTSAPIGQAESGPAQSSQQGSVVEKAKELGEDALNAASAAATRATRAASSPFQSRSTERSSEFQSRHQDNPPSRILYVGNLFFDVTAPQLEQEFSQYGSIVNSRVVTDQRGLSKGFGYVEFANQVDADEAMSLLNQKVFQGRRMNVNYHRQNNSYGAGPGRDNMNKPKNPPGKTLFIGNMSYQMSDRDLNDLFRQIKNVLDVRVAIDRRSGQPRGFAHADFVDMDSAAAAKTILENKVIYGRQLRVDYSAESSKTQNQE